MAIKTASELAKRCEEVAKNYKTLYVLGCFGAPMTEKNKTRYCGNQAYNKQTDRTTKIKAASADTFGFDCVCLIKSLLWDWTGDTSKTYGGASYASNGVPDIGADSMIKQCKDVSADFSDIQVGEAVWMKGHIGVYIGNGLAVECTPKWKDGVQITAVHNISKKTGYNGRKWTTHGKLPYVTYEELKCDIEPNDDSTGKEVCKVEIKQLKKGDKGASVKALQHLLIGYGISCGRWGADGSFGGDTETAVRRYQEKNKLSVDGIVGTNTWNKLLGIK